MTFHSIPYINRNLIVFLFSQDRFGEDLEAVVSSTDEEPEDKFAAEITPDVEQGFLKTLAALKRGDPKIYDEKANFSMKKRRKMFYQMKKIKQKPSDFF
jgi:hypothetical protein